MLEVIVEQLADTKTSLAAIGVFRSLGLVIIADRAEFSMMLAMTVTSSPSCAKSIPAAKPQPARPSWTGNDPCVSCPEAAALGRATQPSGTLASEQTSPPCLIVKAVMRARSAGCLDRSTKAVTGSW